MLVGSPDAVEASVALLREKLPQLPRNRLYLQLPARCQRNLAFMLVCRVALRFSSVGTALYGFVSCPGL